MAIVFKAIDLSFSFDGMDQNAGITMTGKRNATVRCTKQMTAMQLLAPIKIHYIT